MDRPYPTYAGGAEALIAIWEVRRAPIVGADHERLPAADINLEILTTLRVPKQIPDPVRPASGFAKKQHALARDFAGKSELALLNALVVAHLRKRAYPDHAPALFRRIWAEQGAALLAELPMRWLISSAITFGEHGASEADRQVGQSLNILFSLMKLYEFERQFSGVAANSVYPGDARLKSPLPMGMPEFSLGSGGLDINLLAPIWKSAQQAPAIAPLACHLLDALNHDPGTLFRRINTMRQAKRAQLALKADRGP